jgi:hypothetical protein
METQTHGSQRGGAPMTRVVSWKRRATVAFVALGVVGAIAAATVPTASADGRALVGQFGFDALNNGNGPCGPPAANFTIVLTEDGQPVSSLRPGDYWLTVTDHCANHNFELRSCPGSTSPCDQNSGGAEQEITTVAGTPGMVTTKIHLVHGTYRLFCDALNAAGVSHEVAFNMYVDFEVGGVGQVG